MLNAKKVLFVWELGANFGHITDIAFYSKLFSDSGASVYVALKELQNAGPVFNDIDVNFIQAPVWEVQNRKGVQVLCMADIFLGRGYSSESTLYSLVHAWQSIYHLVKPDLVIFDYAPTALLAAQNFTFKKVCVGIGYGTIPYGCEPLNLRSDLNDVEDRIKSSENRVVECINNVARQCGLKAVNKLGDLYSADRTYVNNIPELDLYSSARTNVQYCLPVTVKNSYRDPLWRTSNDRKVFAYFKVFNDQTEKLISALVKYGMNVLLSVRNISKEKRALCDSLGIEVSIEQVDMFKVFQQCDYVAINGGHTATQAVLAAKPVMLMPVQLEQRNTARLVERHQLGVCVGPSDSKEEMESKINNLLSNEQFVRNQVRTIAEKYANQQFLLSPGQIVKECASLLIS